LNQVTLEHSETKKELVMLDKNFQEIVALSPAHYVQQIA
jgi:hypothetical protein